MSYDKDWEVWQALNDPNDPIHRIIEEQQKADCTCDRDTLANDPGMTTPGCPVHDR